MWPGARKWKCIPDLMQQHETTRYKINNVGCLEFCIQAVTDNRNVIKRWTNRNAD